MQLVPAQVCKPIRELRKSLRSLRQDVPQRAVHNLRTRSRKVEAISTALSLDKKYSPEKFNKSIKPLRKAAGEVRDMDVLMAKVKLLLRRRHDPSFERLLTHLHNMRKDGAHHLAKQLKSIKPLAEERLKKLSKRLRKHFDSKPFNARQAHVLFNELSRWPRLTQNSLHDFRIKVKELRYIMQLVNGANTEFMSALEQAKVQIGSWHDWAELHRIASEILNAERDQQAINDITEEESKKFKMAMNAAQLLRTRYLRTHDIAEFAEP